MSRAALLPCPTCPWRLDQDATTIPGYEHEKACGLLESTVGDGDDFRSVMACHYSPEGDDQIACKGYLARHGWSNLNVRLLLLDDKIESPDEVLDACEAAGIELHRDYPEVLAKLAASIGGGVTEWG